MEVRLAELRALSLACAVVDELLQGPAGRELGSDQEVPLCVMVVVYVWLRPCRVDALGTEQQYQ